ncbi:enoyl-ACP reductase FabV [Streptomyces sp. NPDC048603]|uniref:enoyl-ACP reductase FabV n=1 Tax=Streptomyces sp. NPDC048603 TaxID=3365577 RepID=UPI003723AEF0
MIITPMLRGSLCANAHPDGCAERVRSQIRYVRDRPPLTGADRPRNVLVIGGSAGLGLATRIAAGFGSGSATLNVCQESPGTARRTGTAGWYNTVAVEAELARAGLYGRTVLGDAFGDAAKEHTAQTVRDDLGQVDLVVYSLAAPRRTDPVTGRTYRSALKTVGDPFTAKTYDPASGEVGWATVEPATEQEMADTVSVMGGDDWRRWIDALDAAGVLAPDVTTVAFSYVGNARLAPTYRGGTLGLAKEHLEATGRDLDAALRQRGGRALTAVMRAMVTQASSVIPAQTLYTVVLTRVMLEMGLQEGPVEQAHRLLTKRLYPGTDQRLPTGDRHPTTDGLGRLRLDDLELRPDVQAEVDRRLALATTGTIGELGAPCVHRAESLALNGFGVASVDYGADTDPVRDLVDPVRVTDAGVRSDRSPARPA